MRRSVTLLSGIDLRILAQLPEDELAEFIESFDELKKIVSGVQRILSKRR